VGLIQRMAEEAGIPTISLGNMADRMGFIKPPRALLTKFPRGSMFGEPGNVKRQRRIVLDALEALKTIREPGTVLETPYRWGQPDPELLKRSGSASESGSESIFDSDQVGRDCDADSDSDVG
jgi:hypothetical protein